MTDPRVPIKNRVVAGALAILLPGLGHLYQGRVFKGGLYMVCIIGAFLFGMLLGDWRVVAATTPAPQDFVFEEPTGKRISISYVAQVGVGAPAWPALLQSRRYFAKGNTAQTRLSEPLEKVPFEGVVLVTTEDGQNVEPVPISGRLSLKASQMRLSGAGFQPDFIEGVVGEFVGTTADGKPATYDIGGELELGRPVEASPNRQLKTTVIEQEGDESRVVGSIVGSIPRPLTDWYQVPLSPDVQNRLIRRHGPYFDLAAVFTWVAGFLNIFAIWDAVEGPAYGYGDEDETKKSAGSTGPDAEATS